MRKLVIALIVLLAIFILINAYAGAKTEQTRENTLLKKSYHGSYGRLKALL